jgi:DnaJ-class molecular chaperone
MPKKDYYKVLGLNNDATQQEIRKAYLKLAAKTHPDKYTTPEDIKIAHARFIEIGEAYEALTKQHTDQNDNITFDQFFKNNDFNHFDQMFKKMNKQFDMFDMFFPHKKMFMEDMINNCSSYSTSTSTTTTIVNGKRVTKSVEIINKNGKTQKKYTNIDEHGNKTEYLEELDNKDAKRIK